MPPTGGLHNKPDDRPFPGEWGLAGKPRKPAAQAFHASGQPPLVPRRTCFGGGCCRLGRAARVTLKRAASLPASAAAVQESWRAPWARPTQPPVPALVRSLPAQQPPLPSPDHSPAAGGGGGRRTRRRRNEVSREQITAVAGIFKSLILFSSCCILSGGSRGHRRNSPDALAAKLQLPACVASKLNALGHGTMY